MEFPIETLEICSIFHLDSYVLDSSIHEEGRYMAVCCENGSISLMNLLENEIQTTILMKDFPPCLVEFTHHETSILCSSSPLLSSSTNDHSIRYVSLHENKIIRFFEGFFFLFFER